MKQLPSNLRTCLDETCLYKLMASVQVMEASHQRLTIEVQNPERNRLLPKELVE